jgi:autotransporter-associated beta strand protein
MKSKPTLLALTLATALSPSAFAQLTWDPDGNQISDGGAGTWSTGTANWDDEGTAPNVNWANGNNAIFGSGTYQVDLDTVGVTVGDLTYAGGGIVTFKGSTALGSPGDTITVNSGGATWNTGGGQIEFFNDGNNNNTRLSMASGTLTIAEGGEFDTGQNPQNNAFGTWDVAGATLDVTGATIVRGDNSTAGAFATVKLGAGSTYIHERNSNRSYANNWELGGGTIAFSNRWQNNGNIQIDGSFVGNVDELVIDMENGNRIFTLTQANTSFTADLVRIGEGQLNITADNAMSNSVLGLGGISGGISRFNMLGRNQTIKGLATIAVGNTREVRNNNAGTTSILTIDTDGGADHSYAGDIAGGGTIDIVKTGDGIQTFSRTQGYTSAIGNLTVNGGDLVWDVATGEINGAISIGASGNLQVGNGGTSGTIDDKDVANDGTLTFNRTNAMTYGGVISGSGEVRLNSGVELTLGAAQTYSGDTFIGQGILTATAANQLSADSVLRIGGFSGATSAVELGGFAQTVGGLNQNGGNTREVRNNGAETTLTINVGTGESYSYNANFSGTGTINLVLSGDGTQTFSRAAGYTTALGDVTVNNGELVWDSTNAGTLSGATSIVTIGMNGKLSGSGLINGVVSVAGALNPGNSPGTLNFSEALTLLSTATTTLEIAGTTTGLFDVLAGDTSNTLTLGGSLVLDSTGYIAMVGDEITVFENWASFAGTFDSITGTDLGNGLFFDTDNLLIDGTITVVPEPHTGLLGVLAGLLVFARRRRD